ncbi:MULTISPECIES: hypothetical protein [Rhizobium]|uniref:hypothetical protein n=1 Tax=Rhizobium TaxID=379 RepID=UPI001957241C|nr:MULTISPECIES: hypothetical protein [Rhizobium]MBM7046599.1 hypothetical protein [Rhizobium lusitanum]
MVDPFPEAARPCQTAGQTVPQMTAAVMADCVREEARPHAVVAQAALELWAAPVAWAEGLGLQG